MGIIWHTIVFQDEFVEFNEPWIFPQTIPMDAKDCNAKIPGNFKRNWWIKNNEIIDGDYYVTVDDDDMYEPEVFDAIKKMDDDIVIISIKRGDNIPHDAPPARRYSVETLYATPEHIKIGYISSQQSFVKGKIFKKHFFNEDFNCWDGEMAIHHKDSGEQIAYRPDLFALFNYYEPGRWNKKKKMKVSNLHLAIGIPCSFPFIPVSFLYSFLHLERPDFTLIHADNGPIDTLRNDIVEKALATSATHLLMCDTDMIYHPKTVTRLLSHRLPIVGALCFRRYPPFDSIMLKITTTDGVTGYESIDEWKEDELVEVDATGGGCMMFDMEIFRKMPYPWFRFQKNAATGLVIGEDVGFCQDLKAAGYRIFVDTSVPADHLTTLAVNRQTNLLYMSMKSKQQKEALGRALASNENK